MSSPYDHTETARAGTAASMTAFRISEKKYQLHMEQRLKKTKNGRMRGGKLVAQPTDLSDVIDIRCTAQQTAAMITHSLNCIPPPILARRCTATGKSTLGSTPEIGQQSTCHADRQQHEPCKSCSITALTFAAHPGLTVFPAVLPAVLQLCLMRAALEEWPEPPTRTNHTAVYGLTLHGMFRAAQAGLSLQEPTDDRQQQQQWQQQQQQDVHCQAHQQQQLHHITATGVTATSAAPTRVSLATGTAGCSCSSTTQASCSIQDDAKHATSGTTSTTGSNPAPHCSWSSSGKGPTAAQLLRKLRWASLGPPFNWTTRVYEPCAPHRPLPSELITAATYFADLAAACSHRSSCGSAESNSTSASGFARMAVATAAAGAEKNATAVKIAAGLPFAPDVALVNYYHTGDTLNGHKDDVEKDMAQPIVTMSLGCDAVFLMGGQTRDEPPTALLLRSGDVVVLSGPARSCYHGVPRILDDRGVAPELLEAAEGLGLQPVAQYMQQCRVNISVRTTR